MILETIKLVTAIDYYRDVYHDQFHWTLWRTYVILLSLITKLLFQIKVQELLDAAKDNESETISVSTSNKMMIRHASILVLQSNCSIDLYQYYL